MKTIILLLITTFPLLAQEKCKCNKKINDYFFNLEVEASKDSLSKQILNIPNFSFTSTDRIDTLRFSDSNLFITYSTPEYIGMPNFYAKSIQHDTFQSDSLFIFLGGGAGVITSSKKNKVSAHSIETIEIHRDFTDSLKAIEAFFALSNEIKSLCQSKQIFPSRNDLSTFQWEIELENEKSPHFKSKIGLKYYPASESSNDYTVILFHEKYLFEK